ncbi:cytochrome P450 family protein [Nocardiopsis lambiniae]|uniref:Cytochrome P450 n=1 Tax=Nocardiopsis lambiniae TaxID=3075539 RepID=A0ABU2MGZ3_9ACTN|nr:cytochrome P450 [Nocardiopsis sp. DSM 44743]MDT0331982.1 cytochrome P450 [Nocardiopsis sp. DSM 44743]
MPCPVPHGSPAAVVLDPYVTDLRAERETLHAAGPLTRVELPGGVNAWSVTHHEEARALLTDPRLVKDIAHWADFQEGRIPHTWPLLSTIPPTPTNLLGTDGAEHRRLRLLTAKAFSARRVERLRPRVEEITRGLLDSLEPRADAPLDLKAEFAFKLPMSVIGELYGVPEDEHGVLRDLYVKFFSSVTAPEEFLETYATLERYYDDMIAAKRANPGDDLTTALLDTGEDGDSLSDLEVRGTLQVVVAAGHETTVNLLCNAVRALLAHPDQFELVRKGEVDWDAVVEETLRFDPPTSNFIFRFATEDVEVGGVVIAKGEALMTSYGAIGLDRAEHGEDPRPDTFDLTRSQGRHMSFGYGPHVCPGAPLARMEGRIALPMLFDRFPDLRLAVPDGELGHHPSIVVNSLKELPVLLRP